MSTIDPRIHEALDGELPTDALPVELRPAAQTVRTAADLLAAPVPGASLESRIMAEVRRPAPSPLRRAAGWLATPHAVPLRVRPVWSLALAATVVLPTGTYEYMFVVDGERWVPDHLADRLVADDFGRENSVVIVRPVHR